MTPKRTAVGSLLTTTGVTGPILRQPFPRLCWSQAHRHTSSAPGRPERRYPGSKPSFRLSRWQRQLAFGALAGAVAFLAYEVYSIKRRRDSFIPFTLVRKDSVSSTASIFVLEAERKTPVVEEYSKAWQAGIWNVQFKQPQLQIVRAYTPLPPSQDPSSKNELRFLIRKDADGEVSSYLHRLPIGSQIELRGPNLEYEIPARARQVVFFAGGTGIAPALQAAYALFGPKGYGKDRKLHILWANRKREDCVGGHSDHAPAEPLALKTKITRIFSSNPQPPPPQSPPSSLSPENQGVIVQELERLKERYPGQVTVEYFVNEEDSYINSAAACKALSRFDDHDFSVASSSVQDQRQILISGPPGFISYLAGPKEWRNGKEQQGGISKLLAHAMSMNPHNVKIWKI